MPAFEEARKLILERVSALGQEFVPLLDAAGRVLASDVAAPWDTPLWDNSAMDGFALRAADCTGSAVLTVSGCIPAGAKSCDPVAPGTAARILTGAPLPPGADAVAPLEEVEERGETIVVPKPVRPGAHVRRKGEDVAEGEILLGAGTVVGPTEASALASMSRASVPVVRRARVAILSTGDELVEPGGTLGFGQIYNSNALALATAVKLIGGEPTLLGIARDEPAPLRELLREGLRADALITSAGVSVGDRDYVREVLEELAVEQVFWKVDVRPGSPTAFGMLGPRPVFSLPGNPVATLLMFEQLVRPALLKMMGHRKVLRRLAQAVAQEDLSKKPGRVNLLRVRLQWRDGRLVASLPGRQDTGILKTGLRAEGVAVLPPHVTSVKAGEVLPVQVLRGELDMVEG